MASQKLLKTKRHNVKHKKLEEMKEIPEKIQEKTVEGNE